MTSSSPPDRSEPLSLETIVCMLEQAVLGLEVLGISVAAAHAQAALDNCAANKESDQAF